MTRTFLTFPENFVWGTATSAYQIEGAVNEAGRGISIWDTFCRQRGRVKTGESGETATDHYHRWREDVDLMYQLGLNAYRFSIAWTRIVPDGTGAVNSRGLDFYDRLVDGLLARGITPYAALFHYDLPQPLQDKGGWTSRDTARYFGDYARVVAERLSDRVEHWVTHNEPWVTAFLGYLTGEHAPGIHNPFAALAAVHHVLLSHGYAVQALRAAAKRPLQIGIALNLSPMYPASPNPRDQRAVEFSDGFINRITLDPLLKGHYPNDFVASRLWGLLQQGVRSSNGRGIPPADLKIIAQPLDWLGVNYYTRGVVKYLPVIQSMQIKPEGGEFSQMWEIYPQGLYDLLTRLHRDYQHPHLVVSENGAPFEDQWTPEGIHDAARIHYLERHLAQVQRALTAGVPVRGYFIWSLLDNFEWVWGYSRRFGLVYVDFETKARTIKDSGYWFGGVIRKNGLPDPYSQDSPS